MAIEEITELLPLVMREFSRKYSTDISRGMITIPQLHVLEFLLTRQHVRMNELAKSLSVSTAATSGIVDRLVKGGYLAREIEEKDRRVVKVCLTKKGRRWVETIVSKRKIIIRKIFSRLTFEEQENYLRIMKRVYSIVRGVKSDE